jgi:hypothetical protein
VDLVRNRQRRDDQDAFKRRTRFAFGVRCGGKPAVNLGHGLGDGVEVIPFLPGVKRKLSERRFD